MLFELLRRFGKLLKLNQFRHRRLASQPGYEVVKAKKDRSFLLVFGTWKALRSLILGQGRMTVFALLFCKSSLLDNVFIVSNNFILKYMSALVLKKKTGVAQTLARSVCVEQLNSQCV